MSATPEHIAAVARGLCIEASGCEPCRAHDDYSWSRMRGSCETGRDDARRILASTDPAVLDAMEAALVRAGRLTEERGPLFAWGQPNVRLVSEWREVTDA